MAGVAVIAGIGTLDKRVTIQTRTETPDTQGGTAWTWATLAIVWASIVPLRANEVLAAQAIGSQAEYVAEMHYRADVTPKMRLTWRPYLSSTTRTFEIHSVDQNPGSPRRLRLPGRTSS